LIFRVGKVRRSPLGFSVTTKISEPVTVNEGISGLNPAAKLSLPRRFPSLDGWRAISILLVLGTHSTHTAGFPPAAVSYFLIFDGDFGVRCFFVISGFLITWLMIKEHDETGRVSLKHFYIRRALRILPVYFAFMSVLWLLHLF